MLKSRSDAQRTESLAFLTTAVSQQANSKMLPESAATLIPKLQGLLLDTCPKVRQQLLKLLEHLPNEDVRAQTESLLLYLHAAMTTLHSDIRAYSMDALEWLLDSAGQEVVACAGGWYKTLSSFQSLLGWSTAATDAHSGWSSHQRTSVRPGTEHKVLRKQLLTLNRFLRTGLNTASRDSGQTHAQSPRFPLCHVRSHSLPERSNAYSYLNLFDKPRDDETLMMEDIEDRQRVFAMKFASAFTHGVSSMVKEGGDLGRAAGLVKKTVEDSLLDYEHDVGFG